MLAHNQAINALALADFRVIEKEHVQLEKFLTDLRRACACSNLETLNNCQCCNHEKMSSCQGRLTSFLFYVLDIASRHFDHEEIIMLSRPHITKQHKHFVIHRQAHEDILKKLNIFVNECILPGNNNHISQIYHQFYRKIYDLFEEHDDCFNNPFIQSITNKQLKD